MNDLNKDLDKKLLKYLDSKQFERLQFEVDMIGNIEDQSPQIKFYYASSIYLKETSKKEELLLALNLFADVYEKSNHLQSLYNMIAVSFKIRAFKKALKLANKEFEKNKEDSMLIEGLARINFYLGNRKESINYFKLLYELLPEKTGGRLPFISSLNYTSGFYQEDYMEECLKYAKVIEKKLEIHKDPFSFKENYNEKIKLFFLSADFKTHSVTHFLLDLIKNIDRSIFEINLVCNLKISDQDSSTENLKNLSNNWYDVEHYTDGELVKLLRSLNIDVLFDLSGFTQGNRFEILARRCAKLQIVWLGYNNSLGIENSDYIISDKNLIKEDEYSKYKEKILFMPSIWNALSLPKSLPEIQNNQDQDYFTFCSFNNFQKLSDRTIDVWSKILTKSNSKILLKDSLSGGEELKENIINKFKKNGVQFEQLIFINYENEIIDHLKHYNKAEAALDTFPYPGVTTSFEAILMGLPVLTMKGFNMNSRCGESINKNLGMNNLIAEDDKDYINKAISLTHDEEFKKKYGLKLRNKAISSPLFDTKSFCKNFEILIKKAINENKYL